jgi:hypothetical protein
MENLDPFVRWRVPCQLLGGICRRTLYVMVRSGRFPPPDRPQQRRGEPDLWRMSTVLRGVEAFSAAGAIPQEPQKKSEKKDHRTRAPRRAAAEAAAT